MTKPAIMHCLFAAAGMVFCQHICADDGSPPTVKVCSLRTELYNEIRFAADDAMERGGADRVLRRDDLVFLMIAVKLTATWDEDGGKSFRLRADDIRLTGKDGKPYPMVAEYERHGVCEPDDTPGFSFYNRGKPDDDFEGMIFAVPRDEKELVFEAGTLSQKITLAKEPKPFPRPGAILDAKVLGSRLLDGAHDEIDVGTRDVKIEIRNPRGKTLAVHTKLTFKNTNSVEPGSDHIFWHSSWIGLQTPDGTAIPLLGEADRVGKNVSRSWSHNSQVGSEGEKVFFFCVPEGLQSFKLLFCNDPVAEGTVGEGEVPAAGAAGEALFD